jgi:Flp pilus assembly protein TadD
MATLGRTDDAAALLRGLITSMPNNPDLLSNLADILREGSEFSAALPYYSQAITALRAQAGSSPAGTTPPASAWTLYFDRGICEDEGGNWAQAEPDMLAALKLSPNQPYVLNYIAYSWALHGQNLDQARTMLTQAVAVDPNDGAVIDSLGFVEMKLGNSKQAITLLTQAVQLSADDAEMNGHLGDAFWQAGEKLQAD